MSIRDAFSTAKHLPRLLLTLVAVVLLALSVIISTPVHAAGIVTDCSTFGPGTGTLAEALVGGGTITFDCSGTITVPDMFISGAVTIDASSRPAGSVILDGNNTN